MKKKNVGRKIAVIMTLVITLAALSGCAESIQTKEEIVVPKDSGKGEEPEGLAAAGASGAAPGSLLSGIAQQVQAPERYTAEFSEGTVHVKADAPVVIPMAAGFKLYKAAGRVFTQEDYDNINHVLLKDGKLWDRDYEKMEGSMGFTRKEIEEKIVRLKEQMAGDGDKKLPAAKEETYDAAIAAWEERLKEAPQEPVITEIPAVVNYTEGTENSDENELYGYVTVDGKDYFIVLNNNLRDDWKWIQFEVRGPEFNGGYLPVGQEKAEQLNGSISVEKVKEDAQAIITALGFDEFAISGGEYAQSYAWDEATGEGRALHTGYKIYFTRELDGIPVTYTHEIGGGMEEKDDVAWPYETVNVVYDEDGLLHFLWANPYQVEKAGDEYVFLLPFSDIQAVFEKIMPKKSAEWYEDTSAEISYEVNEIRLGYMRVREKGNSGEGTMIPVWDFFGSKTITYHENGEDKINVNAGPYESLLTINAMDGTVINRALGY